MSFSDWDVNIAGQQGQPGGPAGPVGPSGAAGAGYAATSTTSNTIATGSKTFTTQANLAYTVGARARVSSRGTANTWMEGVVTAYNSSTGALTLNVDLTNAMSVPYTALTLPYNYLGGLTLSNDATTPNTVLDIAIGAAMSDDNAVMMTLQTALTKNLNAAWAAGTGNGGLDAGSALPAGAWLHIFLIQRTDTGVVDVLASQSLAAPTLPTNYTKKRRIGTISTNATPAILAFKQLGDDFLWVAPVLMQNNVNVTTTPALYLVSAPPGIQVLAHLNVYYVGGGSNYWIDVESPDSPYAAINGRYSILNPVAGLGGVAEMRVRTNTASQVSIVGSNATTGLYLVSRGWRDYRGK